MPFATGTRLGPYEILAPIGAGGMGEVYRAQDTRLGRTVAIKRLKSGHTARFEQEAHAIAALNHPNICTLHDIGPDYLVMEYVEGTPLQGPLRVEEALRLALQVVGALEEAHAKGILHRDLKPANILVTNRGAAKLLDFGLAMLLTDSDSAATRTTEGVVLGTVAYMAPEQAEGRPLDERSDIFSFGAVLYEMLSGNRAFCGTSTAQVLSAVLRDDPPPLQVPAELQRIVSKCLAKQPRDRFVNMADLRAALEGVSTSTRADPPPSIAVLPFANMSADREQEYFSEGLAEEIINVLGRIPGLNVTARTSAFSFKGKDATVAEIAHGLGVAHVLEGSVRRAGNRLRITTQLIKAADGFHLWSERYDRELTDIFAVQDDIAAAIAGALHVKLVVAPAALRRYTPRLPAYEAYLNGLHHCAKLTPESLAKARESFEHAVALDPGYALPRSALGAHFATLGVYGMQPAHDVMPLARGAAQEALDIDPSLPEAHATLGLVAGLYDYDWREAARLFRLATARDPVPPQARQWYGLYLLALGRAEDAIEEARRALQDDPLNLASRALLVMCLHAAGRDQDAAAEAHRTLELDEDHFSACLFLSLIETSSGRLAEARAFAERGSSLAPWQKLRGRLFAGLLMRTGEASRAEAVLAGLGDGGAYRAPLGFVFYHLVQGHVDEAADWTEKAIEQRDPGATCFLRLPLAAPLRSSTRWPALARMMNLPEGVS